MRGGPRKSGRRSERRCNGGGNLEFVRHFNRRDLERLFDDSFELPAGFLFGVSNSGFQTEGGFNGPGEPLTNWVDFERSGKVERSGEGIRFLTEYEKDVHRARGLGLNAFRMGIEWSRVQPATSRTTAGIPGFDAGAIEHYADVIAAIMSAGMEPVPTLHHFTHPYWLGPDFWLEDQKIGLFERYAEELVVRVNTLLVDRHGLRPVRMWLTINEPNALGLASYLLWRFPHGKYTWGVRKVGRSWGNMIRAHCGAYDAIHRVYRERGWGEPAVAFNTAQQAVYFLDKVITDILNARRNGVERKDLQGYLDEGRRTWDAEVARYAGASSAPWVNYRLERLLIDSTDLLFDLEDLRNGIDALYSSPEPSKLDYLAVDYYDPFFHNMVKAPTLQDAREHRLNINYENWEWVLEPAAMYHFLRAACINAEGLPLLIAENGMAYKVYRGRVERRRDGATRDVFLQCFLYEAMRALKDGLPLTGYLHWTLVDNYEWGSYDPRYGLYCYDRERGERRDFDAWGVDAGAAYADLVGALQSGDRGRVLEAFERDWAT